MRRIQTKQVQHFPRNPMKSHRTVNRLPRLLSQLLISPQTLK